MSDRIEFPQRRCADSLRWRCWRGQIGVVFFDREKSVEETIILGVGYLRGIQNMIEMVMFLYFGAELLVLFLYIKKAL